jgi:hypothetical protein
LIVGLDRRHASGLWIPNTERPGWDPSDPQRHTELFVDTERDPRVHRARVIRLAKVAVKNDGDYKVMCSFNIEALALALELVAETGPVGSATAHHGRVRISGRLPARLGCYMGVGPVEGYRRARPGEYDLSLGVSFHPNGFSNSASFVLHKIRLT